MTPAGFEQLLADVTAAWGAAQVRRVHYRGRKRRAGAGAPFALTLADRLLTLLISYRTHVPHAFLGFLFGVDDSTVCRTNRRVEPLLAGVFRIPERKVELSRDEIRERFFDATERPTNRPGRGQRAFDSGKKKRHTIKHQVVVVRKKKTPGRGRKPRRLRVACVSKSFAGSTHDKRVYDRAGVVIPEGVPACGDTAYLGTGMETPTRKPRGQELTARQKCGNRRISRRRIVVEHGIGLRIGASKVPPSIARRYNTDARP